MIMILYMLLIFQQKINAFNLIGPDNFGPFQCFFPFSTMLLARSQATELASCNRRGPPEKMLTYFLPNAKEHLLTLSNCSKVSRTLYKTNNFWYLKNPNYPLLHVHTVIENKWLL